MGYKKNIASNFITQIIISVLAFLVSVVVSRVLGAEGKGVTVSFLLVFQVIGQYGHFGITSATPYFSKKTEYTSEDVFNSNLAYTITMSILMSTFILIFRSVGIAFTEYNYFIVILGIFVLVFTMISEFLSTFYIANERIVEVNKISLTSNFLKLFVITILWITKTLNISTYLIITSLPVVFNSIFLGKNIKVNFKFVLDRVLIKKEFKFGISIYLATLFIFLNYKVDLYFIDFMLGKGELGVYSTAVSLAEILFMIPSSVASAILGRLYNINDNDPSERKQITSITIKVSFYVTFILMIAGICCTPLIPLVYGQEYSGSIVPTIILFIGILFASIGKISSSYFQSTGEPKIHLYITFSVFALNVILNACLIPIIGIVGAAIASSVSYTFYGISYVVVFVKKENFDFKSLFFINKEEVKSIKSIKNRILKR